MVIRYLGLELGFVVGVENLLTLRTFLSSFNSICQVELHTHRENVGDDVVVESIVKDALETWTQSWCHGRRRACQGRTSP